MAQKDSYDRGWVSTLFGLPKDHTTPANDALRYWSTSDLKFTDTSMGGNLCINPLPQPCIFTDPPKEFAMAQHIGTNGMSPYYSEIFDDTQRIVYFRMGTMAFSALASFIANAYNPAMGSLANRGRTTSLLYETGKVIGFGLSLIAWPIWAMGMLGRAVMWLMGKPSSGFAYLKPGMPNYLSSVQTILNTIMINHGLIFREAPGLGDAQAKANDDNYTQASDQERMALAKAYPDLFPSLKSESTPYSRYHVLEETMQVDVYAVANKAHRMAEQRLELLKTMDKENSGTITDIKSTLTKIYKQGYNSRANNTLSAYIQAYYESPANSVKPGETLANAFDSLKQDELPTTESGLDSAAGKFLKYLIVEAKDGAGFVGFRVESDDSVQETISHNYKQSALSEKINSASATARDTMFNVAGGNISDSIWGQVAGAAIQGVSDLLTGTMEGLGVQGFSIIGGGGVIDIPKYWESSEVNLPKGNYTVKLKARYGNRLSAVNDIYLPLSFLLAMVMNLSVGKSSHTAPFYCMVFDKGRFQSRLAGVSDMTITRGGGNMGFNEDQHVMQVEVNFNVVPMMETLAMPVMAKFSATETFASMLLGGVGAAAVQTAIKTIDGVFDDETPFTDYMATIASMGLWEQFYSSQRLKRKMAMNFLNTKTSFSPTRLAAHVGNSMPAQVAAAFMWYREER